MGGNPLSANTPTCTFLPDGEGHVCLTKSE
jgi:hypothetical protein